VWAYAIGSLIEEIDKIISELSDGEELETTADESVAA
jgi:hypothetical protein